MVKTDPITHGRVLNVVKTMLSDDSVLENEDLHILERMKKFLLEDEVASTNIAKQLLPTVNSMVSSLCSPQMVCLCLT